MGESLDELLTSTPHPYTASRTLFGCLRFVKSKNEMPLIKFKKIVLLHGTLSARYQ